MTTPLQNIAGENVLSAQATSTDALTSSPCRVRGIYVRGAATAGTLVLKDGGASGTTKITLNTPAYGTDTAGGVYIEIPGGGVLFSTSCHATLTTADGVTIFYAAE